MTDKSEVSSNHLKLPAGLSPVDEARWWDQHPEYWDAVAEGDALTASSAVRRTKPVTLRLPVAMVAELKRAAAQRAIPYQTLVRMWLRERLTAEGHPAPP